MKVYTARFPGVWLGGTAVIVAANEAGARRRLRTALARQNFTLTDDHSHVQIDEVEITDAGDTIILDDGNY